MPRNVEVKAKIKDFSKTFNIASDLCKTSAKVLNQEDTFFRVPNGRLKIRNFKDGSPSELIYYNRPDTESPKISDYSICTIENYKAFVATVSSALGVLGIVRKTRYLFLCEQTRIHIDRVEELGDFLELEVVLSPEQKPEEGEEIAKTLMQKLEITDKDLIRQAYVDLLLENTKK